MQSTSCRLACNAPSCAISISHQTCVKVDDKRYNWELSDSQPDFIPSSWITLMLITRYYFQPSLYFNLRGEAHPIYTKKLETPQPITWNARNILHMESDPTSEIHYLLRYINTCGYWSYAHLANLVNIINYYSRDRNPFHIYKFNLFHKRITITVQPSIYVPKMIG